MLAVLTSTLVGMIIVSAGLAVGGLFTIRSR